MANNTDEYWSIDGVSLHQFGWSVATVGGSRYDLPPRRGDNITLAYMPGQRHRPKLPDSRIINLIMWVTGTDPATGNPTGNPRLAWNDNWDTLRRLVWRPNGAQVELTRRWELTVNGTPTIVQASAMAEVHDTMSPTMTGRHRADFTMTLLLADPYFYGTQQEYTIDVDDSVTVNNPGHDIAGYNHCEITFVGPLTDPKLTNTTASPDVWVRFNGTIADGDSVRLDVANFTATSVSDETNHIGKISYSGSKFWTALLPGSNNLAFDASDGTGSAIVRFRPPYV